MKEALRGHKPGKKKKKEGKIKAEYKERWFEEQDAWKAYFSPSVKQGEITLIQGTDYTWKEIKNQRENAER